MRFLLFIALLMQVTVIDAASQVLMKPIDFNPTKKQFEPKRWPYPLHSEVTERLQELTRKYPNLARLHNLGNSVGGYDLWVMEISNNETGPGESKPGLWFDANLHPDELPGRRYLRYFIERILWSYGKDPQTTELVDTRTFYIMPILNPDAGEWYLTEQPLWPGYIADEHPGRDLNGDGLITQMRIKRRSGDPGDEENEYRTLKEGTDPNQRYRGGYARYREPTGEREPTDFNRNWSAEWRSEEPGGGPYPFSQPEVYAVAKFIAEHRNIFFHYTIHTGGGVKSYMVRPPFNHPYQTMHHEDNDFYVRLGAIWAEVSNGGVMENNYYSYQFTSGRLDDEGNQIGYTATMAGFAGDWAYSHQGLFSLTPEVSGIARDYNGDGYLTDTEIGKWYEEEVGGIWTVPWESFDHPELGRIEIGGSIEFPQAYGDKLIEDSDSHYKLLTYVANLAPSLAIRDLKSEKLSGGRIRLTAAIQNTGWLSTYVTRRAIEIRHDFPVVVELTVDSGGIVEGRETQNIGHIPGKFAYIGEWSGSSGWGRQDYEADKSTKTTEWIVQPTGSGPFNVTVEAWAYKAGQANKTITIEN